MNLKKYQNKYLKKCKINMQEEPIPSIQYICTDTSIQPILKEHPNHLTYLSKNFSPCLMM